MNLLFKHCLFLKQVLRGFPQRCLCLVTPRSNLTPGEGAQVTFTPSLACDPQGWGDSQALRIILSQGLGSGGLGSTHSRKPTLIQCILRENAWPIRNKSAVWLKEGGQRRGTGGSGSSCTPALCVFGIPWDLDPPALCVCLGSHGIWILLPSCSVCECVWHQFRILWDLYFPALLKCRSPGVGRDGVDTAGHTQGDLTWGNEPKGGGPRALTPSLLLNFVITSKQPSKRLQSLD